MESDKTLNNVLFVYQYLRKCNYITRIKYFYLTIILVSHLQGNNIDFT